MATGPDELADLTKEIRDRINDNKRFLERILREDFEPEEDDEGLPEDFEEL